MRATMKPLKDMLAGAKANLKDALGVKGKKLNVLVLGSNGMLGYDVMKLLKAKAQQKDSNIGVVIGLDVEDGIDVCSRHALGAYFMNSIHYDYCINCIAYTDTGKAESTPEGKELDYRLNALAPKYIAESCAYWKVKLIHISTDYVFSEKSNRRVGYSSRLFNEDEEPFPVNTYGKNKLLGEQFIKEAFAKKSNEYAILRTSWLYGAHNNKSFIHKFLKNVVKKVQAGEDVTMTSNEVSIPTSTSFVAECIYETMSKRLHGIKHAVCEYNDEKFSKDDPAGDYYEGVTRVEFAQEILRCLPEDIKVNVSDSTGISLHDVKIVPVERDTYQPKYSAMMTSFSRFTEFPSGEHFDLTTFGWLSTLAEFMNENRDAIISWANKA